MAAIDAATMVIVALRRKLIADLLSSAGAQMFGAMLETPSPPPTKPKQAKKKSRKKAARKKS